MPARLIAGDDVASLQQRLLDMGFDCGRVDGLFGVETEQALRDFQRNVGVRPDGTCGPATFKALNQLVRTVVGGRPHAMRESEAISQAGPALSGKLVIVDPGHGGRDRGVSGHGLDEAGLVYDLASRVEGRLTAIGSSAFLTRGPDGAMDEVDRASFANAAGADLVISLHMDAHGNVDADGCASYYYGNDRIGHHSTVGERFADLVQREVVRAHRPDRLQGAPEDVGPAAAHPDAGRAHRARLPHQSRRRGPAGRPALPRRPRGGHRGGRAAALPAARAGRRDRQPAHPRAARIADRQTGRNTGSHTGRNTGSGFIEPSSRSSATSMSSRHDTAFFRSSRSRGKRWCGRTVLKPTASR